MLDNKADVLWQQAFLACDELDLKQSMPLVTKPDYKVAKSLKNFPVVSAAVAKLLAEGPREESRRIVVQLERFTSRRHCSSEKAYTSIWCEGQGQGKSDEGFCRRTRPEVTEEEN